MIAATCVGSAGVGITWRDTVTIVATGVGQRRNCTVAFIHAASGAIIPCADVRTVSVNAVQCTLRVFPTQAATANITVSVSVNSTVNASTAVIFTGWVPLSLTTLIMPPPPLLLVSAAGAQPGVAGGLITLVLPVAAPTASDWLASGLALPKGAAAVMADAPINVSCVAVDGGPCLPAAVTSSTTVTSSMPAASTATMPVTVTLAGGLNLTGLLMPFAAPSFRASATIPVRLLMPPMSTPLVNLTVNGTGLCGGGSAPSLSSLAVGPARCMQLTCTTTGALICSKLNASILNVAINSSAARTGAFALTGSWLGTTIVSAAAIIVVKAPLLLAVSPATLARVGAAIVVTGADMNELEDAVSVRSWPSRVPSILINGLPCLSVVSTPAAPNVLSCMSPDVSAQVDGYPRLALSLVNVAGSVSNSLEILYPTTLSAEWTASSFSIIPVLPTSSMDTPLLNVSSSPVTLRVVSREAATCALYVNKTASFCSPARSPPAAVNGFDINTQPVSVSTAASSSNETLVTLLNMSGLTIRAGSGCLVVLYATCVDSGARSATTPWKAAVIPVLATPQLAMTWHAPAAASPISRVDLVTAPAILPQTALLLSLSINGSTAAAQALLPLVPPNINCFAAVAKAGASLTLKMPLSTLENDASIISGSITSATDMRVTPTGVRVAFSGVDATYARLGSLYDMTAECVWVPTGERVRTTVPLRIGIINASLVLRPPAELTTMPLADINASIAPVTLAPMQGYTGTGGWTAAVSASVCCNTSRSSPVAVPVQWGTSEAACTIMLAAASNATTAVSLYEAAGYSTSNVTAESTALAPAIAVNVHGAPLSTFRLSMQCSLWRMTIHSNTLAGRLLPFAVSHTGPARVTMIAAATPTGVGLPAACTQQLLPLSMLATFIMKTNVARDVTCTAAVDSYQCPTPPASHNDSSQLYGTGFVPAASTAISLVCGLASGAGAAVIAAALNSPSGCSIAIKGSCSDDLTRRNSSSNSVMIVTPRWMAGWGETELAPRACVSPSVLPRIDILIGVDANVPISLTPALFATAASLWTCTAYVTLEEGVVNSTDSSLSAAIPSRALFSSTFATVYALNAAINVAGATGNMTAFVNASFTAIDVSGLTLGSRAMLQADCIWQPTGELLRLRPLSVSVCSVRVSPANSSSIINSSVTAAAYSPFSLDMMFNVLPVREGVASIVGKALPPFVQCEWQTSFATTGQLQLIPNTDTIVVFSNGPYGRSALSLLVPMQAHVEGPTGASLTAVLRCTAWALPQVMTSAPIRINTVGMTLEVVTGPTMGQLFVPSDSVQPVPILPQLSVRISSSKNTVNAGITDVRCKLVPADSALAAIVPMAPNSSFLNVGPDAAGVVTFPLFGIQSSYATGAVVVVVKCERSLGDAPPDATLVLAPIPLTSTLCSPPDAFKQSGAATRPFSMGLIATVDDIIVNTCVDRSARLPWALPLISCSAAVDQTSTRLVSRNASTAANVFLQNSLTSMTTDHSDPSRYLASFSQFMITAQPRKTVTIVLSCAMSSVQLPGASRHDFFVTGCPAGTELQGFFCVKCASNEFSMGLRAEPPASMLQRSNGSTSAELDGIIANATAPIFEPISVCTRCPPGGATCTNGLLELKQHFYRPPRQLRVPLDAQSQLLPCYNTEACIVNKFTFEYSCARGYTGPLCSVCDAKAGYASAGSNFTCAPCASPWVQLGILVVLGAAVLTALSIVALRGAGDRKSDSSISLKILMGYLQIVGSLRTFNAGGTALYQSWFGWTDTFAASPLSISAVQCALRPSYFWQFITTLLLPVTAAAVVVLIFFLVTAVRAMRCRGTGLGRLFDAGFFGKNVLLWLHKRKAYSTLVFVASITYMSLITASLRMLDCYTTAIDGTTYLRADMQVVCGVGDHVLGRGIAVTALTFMVGGVPMLVYVYFSRATKEQLQDHAFSAAFGLLYDGYRGAPSTQGGKSDHNPPTFAATVETTTNPVFEGSAQRRKSVAREGAAVLAAAAAAERSSTRATSLLSMPTQSSTNGALYQPSPFVLTALTAGGRSARNAPRSRPSTVGDPTSDDSVMFPAQNMPKHGLEGAATAQQRRSWTHAFFEAAHAAEPDFAASAAPPQQPARRASLASLTSVVPDAISSILRPHRNHRIRLSTSSQRAAWSSILNSSNGYANTFMGWCLRLCCGARKVVSQSRQHVLWWEAFVLLRKAVVVLIAVLVTNAYTQSALAALWLLLCTLSHVIVRPFAKRMLNNLESMSLISSCILSILSFVLVQFNPEDAVTVATAGEAANMSETQVMVTVAMLLVNFITLLVLLSATAFYFGLASRQIRVLGLPFVARAQHCLCMKRHRQECAQSAEGESRKRAASAPRVLGRQLPGGRHSSGSVAAAPPGNAHQSSTASDAKQLPVMSVVSASENVMHEAWTHISRRSMPRAQSSMAAIVQQQFAPVRTRGHNSR